MELNPMRRVTVPVWFLLVLLAIIAIALMSTAFLIGKVPNIPFNELISSFSWEILKPIFIGTTVTALIGWYLRSLLSITKEQDIKEQVGISTIYRKRYDARNDLKAIIEDRRTKNISITGISLRDIISQIGNAHDLLESILKRLKEEEEKNIDNINRLHVKLLLLDHLSSSGIFRYETEKQAVGDENLKKDVPTMLEIINKLRSAIYKPNSSNSDCFECHIYEHTPFGFSFLTGSEAFTEQYCFSDHTIGDTLPLIKYSGGTAQYRQLTESFNTIWENSRPMRIEGDIGYEQAIADSGIENVFRADDRNVDLSSRQCSCISSCIPGSTIDILSISAKHYTSREPFKAILKKCTKSEECGEDACSIRIAVVNPLCEQAIYRAVADETAPDKLRHEICEWDWLTHKGSKLYEDITKTIKFMYAWKKELKGKNKEFNINIRLYSCSITSSLLLTSSSCFIEQYIYGRSIEFTEDRVLGGEYPVFEFNRINRHGKKTIETEVLSSTFEAIWNSYSISYEEFSKHYSTEDKQEEEFTSNLSKIKSQLCILDKAIND